MSLELKNVTKRVGADVHIHETNLVLQEGTFNILLGTTLAGKTTLMQLMAGLEPPTSGEVLFRGKNVTGVPVQKRNVAMVYQQFINYPNFTVYENIASPLRVAGLPAAEIERASPASAADLLRLTPMLSGGRASFPAASSSAPRSRARWSRTPTSSCSTSRSPISTTSCARSFATSCRSCSPARNASWSMRPPSRPRRSVRRQHRHPA